MSEPTASDRVFARLRSAIVLGEMVAGSSHSIYRMADELGVSRTPVREAVLRLSDHGLVSIERNRGFRVRGVTAADVQEVFELRMLIEVPTAAYAARFADDAVRAVLTDTMAAMRVAAAAGDEASYTEHDRALHANIGEVMGNARVQVEVERLRDSTQVKGVSTIGRSRSMIDVAEEHAPIVDAVLAGDPENAAARMADHLESTGSLLMRQVAGVGESIDEAWAARVRTLLE